MAWLNQFVGKMTAPCTWCEEPAEDVGHDIIGRSEPLGPGSFGPLCEYCEKINAYLWSGYTARFVA